MYDNSLNFDWIANNIQQSINNNLIDFYFNKEKLGILIWNLSKIDVDLMSQIAKIF